MDLKGKIQQVSEHLTQTLTSHNYVLAYEIDRRQQAQLERQDLDALKDKLRPVLTARSSQERSCLEGTRVDPLEELGAWSGTIEDIRKLFWMHGFAGSGKSSIAASVCDILRTKGTLAGSFFCKHDVPEQREPRRILPSLSYTLTLLSRPYKDCVIKALENEPDITTYPLRYQLTTLFLNPFAELSQQHITRDQPIVFVVDALDDCGDDAARSQIAYCLCQIAALADWVKIFVTSRPLPELSRIFSSNNSTRAFDLNTLDVDNDIMIYTKSCLKELIDAQRLNEKWLDDSIVMKLTRQASGLFIWTSTFTQFISGKYDQDGAMEMILSEQNSEGTGLTLDSLYSRVIQSTRGSKDDTNISLVKTVLGVIYITARNQPLSIDGLFHFMPAVGEKGKISKTTLKAIVDDLRSVLYEDSSKGDVIRVCHPSFLDFLESYDRCGEYWMNPDQLNAAMMEKCLITMQTMLEFNVCELQSSYVANKDVPDLEQRVKAKIPERLRYSCLYWVSHYARMDDGAIKEHILEFFRSLRVLYWLEVLSLIDGLKRGLETLQTVTNIYQVWLLRIRVL